MIIVLNDTVCKCGSKEIIQGCEYHDTTGEWHTKQWWEEHPEEVKPTIQKLLAVFDPTNFTCAKCGHIFSYNDCKNINNIVNDTFRSIPLITEEPGICVFNSKALTKLKLTT